MFSLEIFEVGRGKKAGLPGKLCSRAEKTTAASSYSEKNQLHPAKLFCSILDSRGYSGEST
jgi:hypothetical protein